ncbi:AAA family ATPase [Streptomyces mayteni]
MLETIDAYNKGRSAPERSFRGERAEFTPGALAALDSFAAALGTDPEALRPVDLELLLSRVLTHLDDDDRRHLGILHIDSAVRAFEELARVRVEPPPELLEEHSGRLRSEHLSADTRAALERAAALAGELGYDRVLPPHCFLALLAETEGLTERLIRLQIPPQVGLARVTEGLTTAFRLAERGRAAPPLDRCGIGEPTLALLHSAWRAARSWGAQQIDIPHLLVALLTAPPARLASTLEAEPLRLDLDRMREHLTQALRDTRGTTPRQVAFRLAVGSPPSEDLTWLAHTESIPRAHHVDRYFDALGRALHRTVANHVLITGPPGVGATTLLRELARRAAAGDLPFLRHMRFLRVDCHDVPPEESGAALASVIAQVTARTDLVLCLDGLGPLLRGPHGASHVPTLRRALRERRIRLVGVLASQDYEDLIAGDQAMRELATRIELVEPEATPARDMVRQAADALEAEFGFSVDDRAVSRAVVLSRDYLISQRLPLAAVKVLRRAAEDLDYARGQLGEERAALGGSDVVRVVAEIAGVPETQIAGSGGERVDYERLLGNTVFGQSQAIEVVAAELRRIKAGLARADGGPASVMLFAGPTGTGKTELAKALATLYSLSRKHQTYAMANFTERHSVSGIIGSPPGFIGYESGGRLINELNADPYCVFLLDEAEKAHPEVWRPFLNLFDEGWITDQRGIKAHGDRGIFILTTNAGQEVISRMLSEGYEQRDIEKQVKIQLLSTVNHANGGPVFTPEFLARIRRIIVFRQLTLEAMTSICRKLLERTTTDYREQREKELVVSDSLIRHIAARGYRLDQESGGREGARVLRPLLTDLILTPALRAQDRDESGYERCARIEIDLDATAKSDDQVAVRFVAEPAS